VGIFFNLGEFIDVTQKPIKSDIVVCLGGGTIERVKRSISLLENGYANAFILLGESWYNQPYLKKNYPDMKVIIDESPQNTKEEVLFIKKYMVENGYKTVLIVTDPPHSRRVSVLYSVLNVEGDDTLTLRVISSKIGWWKATKYYDDKRSWETVFSESIRIVYSIICYGVIEKLGVQCE
jgi:hypothetical protein